MPRLAETLAHRSAGRVRMIAAGFSLQTGAAHQHRTEAGTAMGKAAEADLIVGPARTSTLTQRHCATPAGARCPSSRSLPPPRDTPS